MATTPELPDTHDPFQLLDVPPDCGARELKRAYVRLIKTFRPDTSPAEFSRIREAFEQARAIAAVPEPPARPAPNESDVEDAARPRDETFAQALPSNVVLDRELSRIERAASGDLGEAPMPAEQAMRAEPHPLEVDLGSRPDRAPLEEEREQPPPRAKAEAVPLPERVDIERVDIEVDLDFEKISAPPEIVKPSLPLTGEHQALAASLEQRIAGTLEAGHDASALEAALTPDVIIGLSRTSALDWQTLRSQRNAGFAARLFQRGTHARAALGNGAPVLPEYKTDSLQQAALAHPELVHVLYDAMGLVCWDDADGVEELLALYPPAASDSSTDLDWLDAALPAARQWQQSSARNRVAPGLQVLLRSMKLDLGQARAFVEAPLEQLAFDPGPWLESLDALVKASPASAELLLHRIDTWLPPDVRTWDEMEPGERDWVIAETERLGSNLHFIGNRFLRLLGIAIVIAILTPTGVGLIVMIIYAVWRARKTRAGDEATYRERLRPAILEVFAARGMTPEVVLEAKIATPGKDAEVARFVDLIERDKGLTLAAALYRLRLALAPEQATRAPLAGSAPDRDRPRALLTGNCTEHPQDEAVCVCTYCQRKACEACTVRDTLVPDYCRDCVDKQAAQKRQRCLRGEGAVFLARMLTLLGSILAAAVCAAQSTSGDHLESIIMAAFAAWGLVASMALRTRKPWAATNQRTLWLPMLLAFPIGTVASVMMWRTFGRPDVKAVLSKDYVRTLALAPEPRRSRLRAVPEPLTAALVVLIIGLGATADPTPPPAKEPTAEVTAPEQPPEKLLLDAIRTLK